jgi:hypothetical protein
MNSNLSSPNKTTQDILHYCLVGLDMLLKSRQLSLNVKGWDQT